MRSPMFPLRVTAVALAVVSVLTSCATAVIFKPDIEAKAPDLPGFGQSNIAITTQSERARQLFNQGVLQAYAFNEYEAERMFKAALAADPDCVMCAWGVAWQNGPNINDNGRDNIPEALQYVGHVVLLL